MRTTTALLFSLALNLCLIAYFSMQLSAAREQSLMLAPSFNVRAAPSRVACNAVPKRTVKIFFESYEDGRILRLQIPLLYSSQFI
mmetsp:Transcript_15161/g.21260  ORF Transcript_15161/g.21260 Transcript_15161/m.21260 type:complete len:85 (-) Transcript_15161:811-1065(-)